MGLQLFTLSGFPFLGRGTTFATFQAWGITLVVKDRLRRKVNSGTRALKASFSIWDDKLADSTDCQLPEKRSNCQGGHTATSRNCPVWKKEKEIITLKTERKISFPEARKLVERTSPSPTSRTYAAAVKPSTRISTCQTELVWVRRDKPVTYTAPLSGPVAAQSNCSQSQTVSALPQVGPSTEQPSHSPTPNSLTPQTQTENPKSIQRGKPQPVAGAMGSQTKLKKRYESDRQPKGSDDPIAQANRYLLLPDDPGEVEMRLPHGS